MKVGIISDTHYGCRKGSKLIHDHFELFYKNIFFPSLKEHGITTVIHMGDAFDSRKSIDYQSLEWAKKIVFDPLKKYQVHLITGNHDCFYKNSNKVNSPNLLLQNYDNIKVYSEATEILIDKLNILLVPWINQENEERTFKLIKNSKSKIVMGHLELKGFRVNKNLIVEDHGLDPNIFSKFKKVFSGHYHTRSNNENIFYLGNPYEIYWSDVNDSRGFTIFDTDTQEHFFIDNPYKLFYNIYYEDTPFQTFDVRKYENKIVKLIVRKKTNLKLFEKFIDKLYSCNIADLKIIENIYLPEIENFEELESEDTLSLLNKYVHDSEVEIDKTLVEKIILEIYKEACEIV